MRIEQWPIKLILALYRMVVFFFYYADDDESYAERWGMMSMLSWTVEVLIKLIHWLKAGWVINWIEQRIFLVAYDDDDYDDDDDDYDYLRNDEHELMTWLLLCWKVMYSLKWGIWVIMVIRNIFLICCFFLYFDCVHSRITISFVSFVL